jgi:hypothetical protein
MRTVLLFLIAALPLASGCTSVASKAGDGLLSDLTTREQVHAMFGTPVATGTIDGQGYEEFRWVFLRDSMGHLVSEETICFKYHPGGGVISAHANVDFRVATFKDSSPGKTAPPQGASSDEPRSNPGDNSPRR